MRAQEVGDGVASVLHRYGQDEVRSSGPTLQQERGRLQVAIACRPEQRAVVIVMYISPAVKQQYGDGCVASLSCQPESVLEPASARIQQRLNHRKTTAVRSS